MRLSLLLLVSSAVACAAQTTAPAPAARPARPSAELRAPSGEPVDSALNARIRDEGLGARSRVLETATMLSDVLGPRLAGSPEYREAAEWAVRTLGEWGLANAAMEPWGKRRGASWSATRHSVELVSPRYERIVAYPRAWSPPTDGVVRGTPKLLVIRADSDLVRLRGQLRGAIVLNGRVPDAGERRFARPLTHRFSDQELDSLSRLTTPGSPVDYWDDAEGYAEGVAARNAFWTAMRAEGVAALLEPSRSPHAVTMGSYQAYDSDVSRAVPAFVVAQGDYARIVNMVERNVPVTLELSLQVRYAPTDSVGHNVVAELPGSDPRLASEVVMVGGHFDSWNVGTGATDNAAGSAVAMEALRILKAVGARPRRTIRLVLWDGEEHEDYWGSMGYVKKHFGDPESMRLLPAQAKVSAYFNFDNGTGRIRGIYAQGNAAVRPILASILEPWRDLGAATTTIKNVGSTDHMPISSVGIPAFTFIQDPVEYESRTHHTNLDVAANLVGDDLKQASTVVASVLYHVANRDALLPRLPLPKPHATR